MTRALISWMSRQARKARLIGLSSRIEPGSGRPLVAGFFGAPSGIGTGGRLVLEALRDAGLDPAAADMTSRFMPDQNQVDWRRGRVFSDDDGIGPVIVHANAPETPYILSELGRKRLEGRLRIAFWAWEFERLPKSWATELCRFHECWAPSRFTADAIAADAGNVPVRAVGYPIPSPDLDPVQVSDMRTRFGVAETGQLVLHAFDMRSSMDRKNPLGAIEIFCRAAASNRDAHLLVKVTSRGWRTDQDRRLETAIAGHPRIHLLTEPLSDRAMSDLMAAADIYLSPHRSEGFGLMLASSLLAGREVMMTGWSGNLDFADLPGVHSIDSALVPSIDEAGVYGVDSGRWAEPDIDRAARDLQDLLAPDRSVDRDAIARAARERFSTLSWFERLGPEFQSRVSDAQKA